MNLLKESSWIHEIIIYLTDWFCTPRRARYFICCGIWKPSVAIFSVHANGDALAQHTRKAYHHLFGRCLHFLLIKLSSSRTQSSAVNGSLARYVKLRVAHAPGMPGTFSPPPRVSDPDMHHGTCVTHVPWCIPGSPTSGFRHSRWRGKRFRHSRPMRNPEFYVSGKRPINCCNFYHFTWAYVLLDVQYDAVMIPSWFHYEIYSILVCGGTINRMP